MDYLINLLTKPFKFTYGFTIRKQRDMKKQNKYVLNSSGYSLGSLYDGQVSLSCLNYVLTIKKTHVSCQSVSVEVSHLF